MTYKFYFYDRFWYACETKIKKCMGMRNPIDNSENSHNFFYYFVTRTFQKQQISHMVAVRIVEKHIRPKTNGRLCKKNTNDQVEFLATQPEMIGIETRRHRKLISSCEQRLRGLRYTRHLSGSLFTLSIYKICKDSGYSGIWFCLSTQAIKCERFCLFWNWIMLNENWNMIID